MPRRTTAAARPVSRGAPRLGARWLVRHKLVKGGLRVRAAQLGIALPPTHPIGSVLMPERCALRVGSFVRGDCESYRIASGYASHVMLSPCFAGLIIQTVHSPISSRYYSKNSKPYQTYR